MKSVDALRDSGILSLYDGVEEEGVGNKAKSLSLLLRAGFPVPPGFIITWRFLEKYGEHLAGGGEGAELLMRALEAMKGKRIIVRSSVLGEDGAGKSFAGIFESLAAVPHPQIPEAVRRLYSSFTSRRALEYEEGTRLDSMSLIVQELLAGEYSGVLFTRDLTDPNAMAIEVVEGSGDKLVSGRVKPWKYLAGRQSQEHIYQDPRSPSVPLASLCREALRIEALFDSPQDIEWTFSDGKLFFLQSRPITAGRPQARDERASEKRRLVRKAERYDGAVTWVQKELSLAFPFPSPLTFSLLRRLYGPRGALNIVSRSFGLPFNRSVKVEDYLESVFGRLYINVHEERSLFQARSLLDRAGQALGGVKFEWKSVDYQRYFRTEFLPPFLRYLEKSRAVDLPRLDDRELFSTADRWVRTFVTKHYPEAMTVNLLASYLLGWLRRYASDHGLEPSDILFLRAGAGSNMAVREAEMLQDVARGGATVRQYLDTFGHRAPNDYELACPRFSEDPSPVLETIGHLKRLIEGGGAGGGRPAPEGPREPGMPGVPPGHRSLISRRLDSLDSYENLKEDARHHILMELALIRKVIGEIAARFGLGDDIFYLTLDEVSRLRERRKMGELLEAVSARKAERLSFEKIVPGTPLGLAEIERIDTIPAAVPGKGGLCGECVSGDSAVQGVARVISELQDAVMIQRGEILIARFAAPFWASYLPHLGGVVTEVGGLLNHLAILAREYHVTFITNVPGAMEAIRTGDALTLHPDGSITRDGA